MTWEHVSKDKQLIGAARGGRAGRGRSHSLEHNAKVARAVRHFYRTGERVNHGTAGLSQKIPLPRRLAMTLLREFPELVFEAKFGRYSVDVYLPPPYHLAFEADGDHWHNKPGAKERDEKRDAVLLKQYGLPVVRLAQGEIDDMTQLLKGA
jgi:hypothetical protein